MKKFAMFIIAIMMMASVCGCSAVSDTVTHESYTTSLSFSDGTTVVDEDENREAAAYQLWAALND